MHKKLSGYLLTNDTNAPGFTGNLSHLKILSALSVFVA